jgi:glycerol-3-phosphate dehydrogenase
VQHLDDLVVRRSNLGANPERAVEMAGQLSEFFDWGEAKRKAEINRLEDHFPFFTKGAKRE